MQIIVHHILFEALVDLFMRIPHNIAIMKAIFIPSSNVCAHDSVRIGLFMFLFLFFFFFLLDLDAFLSYNLCKKVYSST